MSIVFTVVACVESISVVCLCFGPAEKDPKASHFARYQILWSRTGRKEQHCVSGHVCEGREREANDDSLPSIPPDGDEMRTAAFSISRFLPSANDSAAVVDVDFPVI